MLNEEQKQAISILKGPVRIIAGAGTGKTSVLVLRAQELIKNGAAPSGILLLTFTNKAANEIYERLNYRSVRIMTFHALAARLLRRFWKDDFTINPRSSGVSQNGAYIKLDCLRSKHLNENDPETLSFDDLLSKLLEIFEKPAILLACQALFTHIMVDEYQDVSVEQVEIIKKLSEVHRNICVVGDPDQTIYSWRGADSQALEKFCEIYPDAKTVVLIKNYRNPPKILEAAERLISNNPDRIEKMLIPAKKEQSAQARPALWQVKNYFENAEMLAHILEQKLGSIGSMTDADVLDSGEDGHIHTLSDVAIIYRTQEQGRKIAKILERRGYPCQMSSPDNFWERSEIRKFLENLSALQNLTPLPETRFSQWISERLKNFIENENLKIDQKERLSSLLSFAMRFDNELLTEALQYFLDEAKIAQEADNIIQSNAIRLLTFHAAKGLEFPIVLICGLAENIMPYKRSIFDKELLAEERRLLYVGMTRACDELHLLVNRTEGPPSRFLKEIGICDIGVLPQANIERLRKRKNKMAQMTLWT